MPVNILLLTLQLLMLLTTIPLVAASVTISRARKRWHKGFKLAALVIAVLAVVLAVLANSEWTADRGWLATFLPLALNLAACAWVLLRSRTSARLRRRGYGGRQ